jgi:hypothetical protein
VVILQDVVELMYLAASLKLELEMESASGFEMLQTFDDKAAITTRRTTESMEWQWYEVSHDIAMQ